MRTFVSIAVVLIAAALAGAQNSGTDSYKLGDATVNIPAPSGFENIIDAIPNDHGRFSANETAGLLAIEVPSYTIPQLRATPLMSLDLYTRIVVSPEIREQKISAKEFADVVAAYKKDLDNIYDVKGSVMTSARNNIRRWTSQVRGRMANVDFSKPQTIGFFNESPDALSTLMMIVMEIDGRKIPLLVSMSMLHVNDRLVNVSVYKRQPADSDIDMLTDFTKTWTTAILAANR